MLQQREPKSLPYSRSFLHMCDLGCCLFWDQCRCVCCTPAGLCMHARSKSGPVDGLTIIDQIPVPADSQNSNSSRAEEPGPRAEGRSPRPRAQSHTIGQNRGGRASQRCGGTTRQTAGTWIRWERTGCSSGHTCAPTRLQSVVILHLYWKVTCPSQATVVALNNHGVDNE